MLVRPHLYSEIHEDILLTNLVEDIFSGFVVAALFSFDLIQGDFKTTPLTDTITFLLLYSILFIHINTRSSSFLVSVHMRFLFIYIFIYSPTELHLVSKWLHCKQYCNKNSFTYIYILCTNEREFPSRVLNSACFN